MIIQYVVIIPLMVISAVLGNLMTIVAFWKVPKLREKPSDLLICALACVDFATGLFVIPLIGPLYITPGNWPLEEIGCRVHIASSIIVLTTSLYLLIFISFDRYLLVSREYPQYLKTQSERRIYKCIVFSLSMGVLAAVIEQSMWDRAKAIDAVAAGINFNERCLSPPRRLAPFSTAYFLAFYLLPVIAVSVLSVAFLYLFRKRLMKKIRIGPADRLPPATLQSTSEDRENSNPASVAANADVIKSAEITARNRYIKPAITLIGLVTAMGVCMLPYCFYVIVVNWFCTKCSNVTVLYAVLLLQYCNSCLDPMLYAATQNRIRKFYRSRFRAVFRF